MTSSKRCSLGMFRIVRLIGFLPVFILGCSHSLPSVSHSLKTNPSVSNQPCTASNFNECAIERYNGFFDQESDLCFTQISDELICSDFKKVRDEHKNLINYVYVRIPNGDKYPFLLSSTMDPKEHQCNQKNLRESYICKTQYWQDRVNKEARYIKESCTDSICKVEQ